MAMIAISLYLHGRGCVDVVGVVSERNGTHQKVERSARSALAHDSSDVFMNAVHPTEIIPRPRCFLSGKKKPDRHLKKQRDLLSTRTTRICLQLASDGYRGVVKSSVVVDL